MCPTPCICITYWSSPSLPPFVDIYFLNTFSEVLGKGLVHVLASSTLGWVTHHPHHSLSLSHTHAPPSSLIHTPAPLPTVAWKTGGQVSQDEWWEREGASLQGQAGHHCTIAVTPPDHSGVRPAGTFFPREAEVGVEGVGSLVGEAWELLVLPEGAEPERESVCVWVGVYVWVRNRR